jgi:hypothetical protein
MSISSPTLRLTCGSGVIVPAVTDDQCEQRSAGQPELSRVDAMDLRAGRYLHVQQVGAGLRERRGLDLHLYRRSVDFRKP